MSIAPKTPPPRPSKFAHARQVLGPLSLAERLLLWASRHPRDVGVVADYESPSTTWNLDNALAPFESAFPQFREKIRGKRVLDYGCGDGFQAVAMAQAGASSVVGVEVSKARLVHARALARESKAEAVEFTETVEGPFDVVISLDAVEHFVAPEENLRQMLSALGPGGSVFVTFGPPWFAPYGHHMYYFTRMPWLNLFFSERTVYRIRSLYRTDGATTYSPDLNQMTLKKFEKLLRSTGARVESMRYRTAWGLPLVSRIPFLREFFVNQVDAVLGRNRDELIPMAPPAKPAAQPRPRGRVAVT